MNKFKKTLAVILVSAAVSLVTYTLLERRERWAVELRTYEDACLLFVVKDGRQAAHYKIDCADTTLFR